MSSESSLLGNWNTNPGYPMRYGMRPILAKQKDLNLDMGVSPKSWGIPKNTGWMRERAIKMGDWGVPPFMETPIILIYTYLL